MNNRFSAIILALSVAVFGVAPQVLADPTHNPPLVCAARASCSTCPQPDGCACGCILVTLDLGATTVWTGQTPVYLRIHSSDETASLSTPAQLKVVMGWSFKAVDGGTTAGGAPQIVRFVQPEGAELVVHFQDGDAVGVPEPNNLGKSLARVRMVDAEGWATTSAPAFYDLYPGDGSVWRFLATGNTNERGALVSFTDPRGRVLTPDDFGVDIVRDALGNIRQVKTLTRLADVRTLSPTHYAVTVYPLAEEPEQVADTGLYALPEHAPTRVLDVAQGESVKELLVGFQKGTGDMRQYRYVAVNGDWTLYQPSGLVEAQELYFTEDESGAQRLHTIRDETGKLWSRDEYNYVSAYWGYLITNRIEGIPGDATRTTSWSYYTDGPHKDLLRETVEPTGNRILYEYDAQNRVIRESMPLVEEETLYSYAPVDPSDPPLLCDTRPRCVVRKMQGVEIQRTYYVYGTNGVDVVERVGEQGAAYGGTNVLRTVTTYYPATGAVTDGLVQSVRHEDGTIDNYAYDLTDGVWTETVTHVHEQAPAIVPMRTTRSVRVYNALGQLVDSRTDLCTIGVEDLIPQADWTPIERIQYSYDVIGNLVGSFDLFGLSSVSEFGNNCCGMVSSTDKFGIEKIFSYDDEGRLLIECKTSGNHVATIHQYDKLGREIGLIVSNLTEHLEGSKNNFEYDSLNRLVEETDEFGNVECIRYSENELVVFRENQNGLYVCEEYYLDGRIKSISSNSRRNETYQYGVLESGTTWSKQLVGVLPREYVEMKDMLGRVTTTLRPGYDNTAIVTLFKYQESLTIEETHSIDVGRETNILTRVITCDNIAENIKTVCQDENLNGIIDFIGEDRISVLEKTNLVIDANIWQVETEYSYFDFDSTDKITTRRTLSQLTGISNTLFHAIVEDGEGLVHETLETVDRSTGTAITKKWTPESDIPEINVELFGLLVEKDFSNGKSEQYEYDELDRVIKIHDTTGLTQEFKRDNNGRVVSKTSNEGDSANFTYDSQGNIVKIETESGIIHQKFNAVGDLTHRFGTVTPIEYSYDAEGHVISVSRFTENVFDFDDFSHSNRTTISFLYDPRSNLLKETVYGDGSRIAYQYTPDGRLLSRTSARGILTHYAYDRESSRVVSISYSDGTPTCHFTYDRLGRRTMAWNDSGTTNQFVYVQASETITEEIQAGFQVQYGYTNGVLSHISANNGYDEHFCYDNLGNLSRIEISDMSFLVVKTNDVETISCSTGIATEKSKLNSKTNLVCKTFVGEEVLFEQESRSDLNGFVRTEKEFFKGKPSVEKQYDYDCYGQLTSLVATENGNNLQRWQWCYDSVGNRIATHSPETDATYLVTNGNQYVEIDWNGQNVEVKYDSDGNLVSDGTFSYEWDGENRLVSVIATTNSTDVLRVDYFYDYLGRTIRKNSLRADGTSSSTTYLWKDFKIIQEVFVVDGMSKTNSYYWCPDEGTGISAHGLVCCGSGSVWHFPISDIAGNIRGYYHPDSMSCLWNEYDPYGHEVESQNDRLPHLFSSSYYDFDSELYNYGLRFYSPRLGCWISRDPVWEQGRMLLDVFPEIGRAIIQNPSPVMFDENEYRFVKNNPLYYHDSAGLLCQRVRYTESYNFNTPKHLKGAFQLKGAIQYRFDTTTCDICCPNGQQGKTITTENILRGSAMLEFTFPIGLSPFSVVAKGGGTAGGSQRVQYNSCTGETKKTGCFSMNMIGSVSGCLGKLPPARICVGAEGVWSKTWCADGSRKECASLRGVISTYFLWRCYDFVFAETAPYCW